MSKKLKTNWAIVGLGNQAEKIAQAINSSPTNELQAVMSGDDKRARSFAKNWKAKEYFTSLANLLKSPKVDAVFIASPNYKHVRQSLAALKMKKHVLCEKPMAITLKESLAIKKLTQKNKTKFGVGFHLRCHPLFQTIKKIITAHDLGELRLIEMHWSTGYLGEIKFAPLPEYRRWREHISQSGGGAITSRGVHLFDLFNFITEKKIKEIICYSDSQNREESDKLIATTARSNKTLISIISGRQIPEAINHITIYGSHGRLFASDPFSISGTGNLHIITNKKTTTKKFTKKINIYQKEIEAFSKYINTDKKGSVADTTDGLQSVAITEACLKSIELKKVISITKI